MRTRTFRAARGILEAASKPPVRRVVSVVTAIGIRHQISGMRSSSDRRDHRSAVPEPSCEGAPRLDGPCAPIAADASFRLSEFSGSEDIPSAHLPIRVKTIERKASDPKEREEDTAIWVGVRTDALPTQAKAWRPADVIVTPKKAIDCRAASWTYQPFPLVESLMRHRCMSAVM